MILVVGATGLLGTEICGRLRARQLQVRALVRRGSTREDPVRRLGAEICYGDLRQPQSLDEACRGCAGVITTANSMLSRRPGDSFETVDHRGSLDLLRAAERAGAGRFVYTSLSPVLPSNNDFVRSKRDVERAVRASSLSWTILQPSAFMEIHAGEVAGWDFVRGRARLLGSGRATLSFISMHDVAAFAVSAVDGPHGACRNLHVTGPEPLTGLDAVAIAERVTGRKFSVQRLPTTAIKVLRLALKPVNPRFSALFAMGLGMQLDDRADMEPLWKEFDVRPTTFEAYVRSKVATGGS